MKKESPSPYRKFVLNVIVYGGFLFAVSVAFYFWKYPSIAPYINYIWQKQLTRDRLIDNASVFPEYDTERFNEYCKAIFYESDIDFYILTVNDTGGRTLEDFAASKMDELGVGGEGSEERGVLVVYDVGLQKLRIEVGYGLEEYFPDILISYLIEDHAVHFFALDDVSHALHLLIRILHHRIREAILGETFDPRVVKNIRESRHLSGGGGASLPMPDRGSKIQDITERFSEDERRTFSPGLTPEDAYKKYLHWMLRGVYDPDIDLFTQSSRGFLSTQVLSSAYIDYMLLYEYGRAYEVVERKNFAVMYFTDSPFVTPHFFRKDEYGWRMDISVEIDNTKELVGGSYTWTYIGTGDDYTRNFYDLLKSVDQGPIRFIDGDNRKLQKREQI